MWYEKSPSLSQPSSKYCSVICCPNTPEPFVRHVAAFFSSGKSIPAKVTAWACVIRWFVDVE